jgi:drug/metabolite transporter (DMT)-like permease
MGRARILLLLVIVIWGYTWIPMKTGLTYLGPFSFSFYRFLIGTIALLPFAFWGRGVKPHWKEAGWIILLGLLQTTGTFGFWMSGMTKLPAGLSSILAYTMPLWTFLLTRFILSEPITLRKGSGLFLGILGLFAVAGPEIGTGIWKPVALVVAGSICWAGSNVLIRARFARHNKLILTFYQMMIGSLGLAILALWFEPESLSIHLNRSLIEDLLFTGLFSSAFAFVIWFYAVSRLGAREAAVSVLMVPVFALLFGWWLLNESISWIQVGGIVLVLSGVTLVQSRESSS